MSSGLLPTEAITMPAAAAEDNRPAAVEVSAAPSKQDGELTASAGAETAAAAAFEGGLPRPPLGTAEAAPTATAESARDEGSGDDEDQGAYAGPEPRSSSTLEVKSEGSEIHHYAQAGDVKEVRRCLLAGYNKVDEVDELGCTPLHLAGAMGHVDVVRLLVKEHGADVDARDVAHCTALHAASEGGYPQVVELLLQLGADIDARNGRQQTPLHYACGYGQVEAARQLLLQGASAGARDVKGNTPLHLACGEGGVEVVRLLLRHGSNLDVLNQRGRQPLHMACRNGNLEVAVELLKSGADPSARDGNRVQALDMIGAGRQIPQGRRLDLVNTLERYQLGEHAMSRSALRSTRSIRQMWRDRDHHNNKSSGTPRVGRPSDGPAGPGPGAGSSSGAAAAAAATTQEAGVAAPASTTGDGRSFFGSGVMYSRAESFSRRGSSIDGFSTSSYGGAAREGGGGGPFRSRGAAARAGEGAGAGRNYHTERLGEGSGRRIEGGGEGIHGCVDERSPRWTVGAAVAGRLEEMRARELAATLRATVQENEAMKRYIASVEEEMRVLQHKVAEQSSQSPPLPPRAPNLSVFPARDHHHRRRLSTSSVASTPTTEHQLSIAEMVARGMYGSEGIEVARRHASGGGGGGNTGLQGRSQSVATEAVVAPAVIPVGAMDAFNQDAGGGEGAPPSGPAPSHGSARAEGESSKSSPAAAVAVSTRDQAPPSIDGTISGGGSSADQPGDRQPSHGGRPRPVSISQLLDAKRAQLQELLDASHAHS